jgi:hypothetical protein
MRNLTVNRLVKEGVPVNKALPEITIKKVRTSKDVGVRLNILAVFLAISDDSKSIKFFNKLLKEQGMYDYLTTTEKLILDSEKLTKQQEIDLSWNQESIYALSWCLGIASKMSTPIVESDLNSIFKYLPPEVDLKSFLDKCNLIDSYTILEELEYYYGLHWAVRHPENWEFLKVNKFKISIIRERRKAMEWVLDNSLIWDDIALDT